jgi:hypothetical protein
MFSNVHRCLTAVHTQVGSTTYDNDPACTVSIESGTHACSYVADEHDSIQAIADNGTVLHGAMLPKDAP